MGVSYKRLFHMLVDKRMTNAELRKVSGCNKNICTRLMNDEYISLANVEKICKALNCGVDDILEFTEDNTIDNV